MTTTPSAQRTVLKGFPAAHPRGSWPADEYAAERRAQGQPAWVVMSPNSDEFLVVTDATAPH
ncbi:hypothetical protein [Streptomyces sp. Ac-502]|uniref:hypothetical protein n=1 Tax=Streptomyces sp. Ac-502 TaxID=3342801 RepID=UPI0038624554